MDTKKGNEISAAGLPSKAEWILVDGQPVKVLPLARGPPGGPLVPNTPECKGRKLVEGKDQGDIAITPSMIEETRPALRIAPRVKEIITTHRSKGRKFKANDPVKARLVGNYVLTSAAATALTTVQALTPLSVTDFSSFAALFDLVRCEKLTVLFRVESSGAITGSAEWAMAIDPSNIGAYASVADVLTAQHHYGPGVSGNYNTIFPQPVNGTGFHTFGAKLVAQRVTNDGSAAAAVGGGWMGTSDTTNVVAWFKPYVASFGGALTSTVSMYVIYDCEFKTRT